MPSKANVKSTILPKRAQKQKQKQSVVVNVNLGKSKKSTSKSTRKSSTTKSLTRKSSVLPPPIHPVYVSPIHNLNPSIYHQGQQLPNQFYNQEQSYLRAAEPSYSSPSISTKSSPVSFTQSIQNPVSSIHRPAVYKWGETLQRMPQNMPSQQSMDDLQNEIRDLNNSYSIFTGSPTSGMPP